MTTRSFCRELHPVQYEESRILYCGLSSTMHSSRIFHAGPLISLSMGERGVITRILSTKYGGYLTFAAMSAGEESAPGQPSVSDMQNMYASQQQTANTKVYGIIGNPVSHSRSPVLHNASMQEKGFDGVYVPLLVDSMQKFVSTFNGADWAGFSVTIPHKVRFPHLIFLSEHCLVHQ